MLCGGTGLYFKALLEGIDPLPSPDPILRAQLELTPLAELQRELEQVDPEALRTMDRENPRRVIRAVEIIRLTGRRLSEQRTRTPAAGTSSSPSRDQRLEQSYFFGLDRTFDDLHRRIDRRVEAMFQHGLVAETQALLDRGLERNRTAMQAIGYHQVVEYLRGARSLAETVALVKLRTRQLAKRQRTWFKHQANLTWIHMAQNESPPETAAKVMATLRVRP